MLNGHHTIVKSLIWHTEDDTAAWAQRLGAAWLQLQPASFVWLLHGNLGAGKTTTVRHVLRALGVQGRIKSPTYAVTEPHHSSSLPQLAITHCDFYRFSDPQEWEDAGLRDLFAAPGLKLCEWPEQAAGMLPLADWDMHIEPDAHGTRHVRIDAHSTAAHALLKELDATCTADIFCNC